MKCIDLIRRYYISRFLITEIDNILQMKLQIVEIVSISIFYLCSAPCSQPPTRLILSVGALRSISVLLE